MIWQVTIRVRALHERRTICMRCHHRSFIAVKRFERRGFIHVTEVEDKIEICHGRDQIAPLRGQWTRLARATAIARPSPGETDESQAHVIPFTELMRRSNSIRTFHEIDQPNRMSLAPLAILYRLGPVFDNGIKFLR